MNAILESTGNSDVNKSTRSRAFQKRLATWCACFFFVGGFIASPAGLVFIIFHSVFVGDHILGGMGTVLMIVSIPMLLAGSHLMDVASRNAPDN